MLKSQLNPRWQSRLTSRLTSWLQSRRQSRLTGILLTLVMMGLVMMGLWLSNTPIAAASIFAFHGDRPPNLGMHLSSLGGGQFAPCAPTPNCVSSQASDGEHQIAPIIYQGNANQVWADLAQVVARLPNTTIVTQSENYLYAEFTSHLMGFVDDVEFYLTDGAIQVRSASRLGESDLGVNRQRIETIRAKLQQQRE
jgi:uncharacterized protein (DUF1499 family)